jgi:hypothetical protein
MVTEMFDKIVRIKLSSDWSTLERVGDGKWKQIPNKQNTYIDQTVRELSDAAVLGMVIDNLVIKGIESIQIEQVVDTTYYLTQVYGERY